jgi:iron complex transport system substrate-binding protein
MMILAIVFYIDDIGASGYTLGIFGNANMDGTIDESDITYVNDIINGTFAPTNLSDANYDGKIDASDIDQIRKIINGAEERLTFLDATGEAETIRKPIVRIVTGWTDSTETLRALHAADKIVGIDPWTQKQQKFYPDIGKLPAVSHPFTPDYEAVMSLHPDAVMPWVGRTYSSKDKNELKKNLPDIAVICLAFGFTSGEVFKENVMKLGYIIDKRDEAHSFIDFYDNIINGIWERTKDLTDEEKPRAYVESYRKGSAYGAYRYIDLLDIAGGENIASDISGSEVDPEWVITQNPDFIIIRLGGYGDYSGYEHDNSSEMIAVRDEMLNRSELANANALKSGRVYVIDAGHLTGGPGHFLSAIYFAKWLHPDLFTDLDPQAIHQEYLTRFQHLDYDLDKHGVFVYPSLK